jgi:transposase
MTDTLFAMPEPKDPATEPPKERGTGRPRLLKPNREQVEFRLASLEAMVPDDHRVRLVWAMVQEYDLSEFYEAIEAIEGEPGHPAIDPRVLLAVWLYATLEGVGAARQVERLCQEHLAYRWLLGGVSVNYHTLSDFRSQNEAWLDRVLTRTVAAAMNEGLVDLEQTAQDGMRIRANAGASSFRRKPTLAERLQQAAQRVQQLKTQVQAEGEPQATKRQQAARERQARERVERLKRALDEVDKVVAKREKNHESRRQNKPVRASTTDPEARVMKMPDGGFRPALNGQLNVDMKSRVIVGVDVSNETDQHLLEPMLAQTEQRYGRSAAEVHVDGGFRTKQGINAAGERGIKVFVPIPQPFNKKSKTKPEEVVPSDSPHLVEWKQRMVTAEAKEKYKRRAATVEWANALLRNRGLLRFLVRGLRKARSVLLLYALAHNLVQIFTLREKGRAAMI